MYSAARRLSGVYNIDDGGGDGDGGGGDDDGAAPCVRGGCTQRRVSWGGRTHGRSARLARAARPHLLCLWICAVRCVRAWFALDAWYRGGGGASSARAGGAGCRGA